MIGGRILPSQWNITASIMSKSSHTINLKFLLGFHIVAKILSGFWHFVGLIRVDITAVIVFPCLTFQWLRGDLPQKYSLWNTRRLLIPKFLYRLRCLFRKLPKQKNNPDSIPTPGHFEKRLSSSAVDFPTKRHNHRVIITPQPNLIEQCVRLAMIFCDSFHLRFNLSR